MKLHKSKTEVFNVVVPAIYGFVRAMGWNIPEEIMVGVLSIGNFILRFFTNKPLSEK